MILCTPYSLTCSSFFLIFSSPLCQDCHHHYSQKLFPEQVIHAVGVPFPICTSRQMVSFSFFQILLWWSGRGMHCCGLLELWQPSHSWKRLRSTLTTSSCHLFYSLSSPFHSSQDTVDSIPKDARFTIDFILLSWFIFLVFVEQLLRYLETSLFIFSPNRLFFLPANLLAPDIFKTFYPTCENCVMKLGCGIREDLLDEVVNFALWVAMHQLR